MPGERVKRYMSEIWTKRHMPGERAKGCMLKKGEGVCA